MVPFLELSYGHILADQSKDLVFCVTSIFPSKPLLGVGESKSSVGVLRSVSLGRRH